MEAPAIDDFELIPRRLLFGNPTIANVQISPDGRYLSWLAPDGGILNVWVSPADDPASARAVTHDRGRGIRTYHWTHRPDTLVYLRDTGGDEDFHLYSVDVGSDASRDLTPFPGTTARVVKVSHLRPGSLLVGINDRDPQWHDIYEVDLGSGQRTLVDQNDHQFIGYIADSRFQLRFGFRTRPDASEEILVRQGDTWVEYDVIPFEDTMSTYPAGMTTDGRTLYLIDSRNRNTAALAAVDLDTGDRALLHQDDRADIGGALAHPETGAIQAVAVTYHRLEWFGIDPDVAADLARLEAIGPGEVSIGSRTLDDRTWIVTHSAAERPLEYYRYDRDGEPTHLFSGRPDLAGKPLMPQWPVEISTRDGLDLVGYVTLPPHVDPGHTGQPLTPSPIVLFVHGGPWARDVYGYDPYVQWLANRGYAVLQVNFRGSTGLGKALANAGDGEWGAKMHDDLLDALGWAVEAGITTRERAAIMGGSYGGYATLAGLTFTPEVFACGVDIVGPSNLETLLATVPPYWAGFFEQLCRRMGDPRTEEGKAWLRERSPLHRADRIERPLLIGQGANDPRVKQAESDQIVAAMQERGIGVTYVLFPDEGHGFARPENNSAFQAIAEGFLAEHLGGRAEPIGDDLAGSSTNVPVGADGVPGLAEALAGHEPVLLT